MGRVLTLHSNPPRKILYPRTDRAEIFDGRLLHARWLREDFRFSPFYMAGLIQSPASGLGRLDREHYLGESRDWPASGLSRQACCNRGAQVQHQRPTYRHLEQDFHQNRLGTHALRPSVAATTAFANRVASNNLDTDSGQPLHHHLHLRPMSTNHQTLG